MISEKSILIKFDPFWTDLIQKIKKTVIFILFVNVKTFNRNTFWFVRNPFWSSLIKFDPFWTDLIQKNQKQTSHCYPLWNPISSSLIKFDPFWTDLMYSDGLIWILDAISPLNLLFNLEIQVFFIFDRFYSVPGIFCLHFAHLCENFGEQLGELNAAVCF